MFDATPGTRDHHAVIWAAMAGDASVVGNMTALRRRWLRTDPSGVEARPARTGVHPEIDPGIDPESTTRRTGPPDPLGAVRPCEDGP
jgi:hypothetical protein